MPRMQEPSEINMYVVALTFLSVTMLCNDAVKSNRIRLELMAHSAGSRTGANSASKGF